MKKSLLNFSVGLFFLVTSVLPVQKAFALENKFCLENDGFITPIIPNEIVDCNEILNINEFKHLISIDKNIRVKKLKEFRSVAKNKPKNKEINKDDVKKATNELIAKSTFEQKRLKRIADAKQKRIENQKKLLEKRIQAKKANEEKRFKRLQEIEKKKQERLQKQLALKQEKERKRKERNEKKALAKKERENILKKRKEKLAAQKQLRENKFKQKELVAESNNKNIPIKINTNLKVINYEKEIVKKEMFPNINKDIEKWNEKEFSFEATKNLSVKSLKDLLKSDKNLIVLIPKDFDSFANNVSQNQMMSKVVSGIRQVPNPEFTRLEAEIRDKERRAIMAKREAENFEARLNNPYRQSSGIGWLDILAVAADTGGAIKYWDNYTNLQDQVSNLVNQYSNTPMTIDKKMYSSYNYLVNNIKAEKKVSYNVLFFQNETFLNKDLEIKEAKDFKIASGINPQDEKYNSLIKKYDSENDLNSWNNKKINEQKISGLLVKLLNENSTAQKISNKDAYKMLDSTFKEEEKKSFWDNLFSSNKKEKKNIASLPKNNKYEISDSRFESVVVVKTGSGLGSGFYVNDDEIVTNYHVIENARNITVIDKDKKRSSAVVIKKDLKRDLALLKTNAKGKKVSFFDAAIKQGSKVEALGHPRGKKFSISQGIVSAIRKESSVYNVSGFDNVLFIQTDAAINKGNSGGPLFMGGKVVGVNTQGLSKKTSEGMGFAVHFSEVLDFLK